MKDKVMKELKKHADKEKAAHMQRFFKTGKGEYAEGDVFLGLTSPQIRAINKTYWQDIALADLSALLHSPLHEARSAALIMLVSKFNKAGAAARGEIAKFYLAHTDRINNWDLVDISAPHIIGAYYFDKDLKTIKKLAKSKNMWEQRIAMVSLLYHARQGVSAPVFELAEGFLTHKHDLMHKATGWLLREAGKKDPRGLLLFLDAHGKDMPRTALRYSIERLSPAQKKKYMAK